MIAGHGEKNESAKRTLIREAKEEAGLSISLKDIKIAYIMHRKAERDERVDFFFTVKRYKDKPRITEPEKCDDMRWFPLNKLPKNIIPYMKEAIKCYQKGILYSEYGWEK